MQCQCTTCRHLEELEQRTLALEQGPRGFEEPSISGQWGGKDGDDEHRPHVRWAARPVVQQKEKDESSDPGAHPSQAPSVTEFTTIDHVFRQGWLTVHNFSKGMDSRALQLWDTGVDSITLFGDEME